MTDSKEIDWGGSAFPCEGGSDSNLYPDPGMSIRDYFAAQAIVGISTWAPVRGTFDLTDDDIQSQSTEGPTYLDFITPDDVFDKGPTAVQEWQDAKRAALFPADNGRAE